ncbi:MAG: sulfite exporter TauE/SafE family protein [Ectothiorhodospiraceae bacterium]|nr:sulfite exporter TauE/SafE family protein [Chromatiales bacterium]MCP5156280.1 sulfite exporter TauE/SafE family protein [Ectothiorhodospiraceae bacterium]
MPDTSVLAAVVATFLAAGIVKGVVGMGLPTVSLAVLVVVLDLPSAMALLVVPSFVTNLWQATSGGQFSTALRRIWPFLAAATVTVWLGALALSRIDTAALSTLLGVLLVVYAGTGLAGVRLRVPSRHECWVGPVLGSVNGILTGMTGSFVFPGVPYLQGIGLPRDVLVQAMGMLFTLSTVALAVALRGAGLLSAELGLLSAVGLVPAVAGMVVGQRIRRRLSETAFRRALMVSLAVLGAYIVLR